MSLKVLKFGGSSLADAEHFRAVADIVKSESNRRYVVASAPGKRFSSDIKVTDMLYKCYELLVAEENYMEVFDAIIEALPPSSSTPRKIGNAMVSILRLFIASNIACNCSFV